MADDVVAYLADIKGAVRPHRESIRIIQICGARRSSVAGKAGHSGSGKSGDRTVAGRSRHEKQQDKKGIGHQDPFG
jgi:hypothetical protein